MTEPPRRTRRSGYDGPAGKHLPILPLAIIVILAGLALGALAARFLGRSAEQPAATTAQPQNASAAPVPTAAPETAVPPPKPSRSAVVVMLRTPGSLPANRASARATFHRIALATPKPSLSAVPAQSLNIPPTRRPSVASASVAVAPATPRVRPISARPPIAAPSPMSPSPSESASNLARTYLTALMRGDRRSAAAALGQSPETSSLDESQFLDSSARITSVHTLPNGDGSYKVESEVTASKGTYFVTMQVSHVGDGYVITDHHAIRIQ
ncbi:MAG: hypothetical protein DLM50_07570 [Candidatus Meridianibacter frigidus]|nr:MAG: hypothetical protein DLM50_07570 [Candidatus Eremiobacteraeota bacterium]